MTKITFTLPSVVSIDIKVTQIPKKSFKQGFLSQILHYLTKCNYPEKFKIFG